MVCLIIMFLLLIEQIVSGKTDHITDFELESKLRDLLELDPPEKSLILRADVDDEPEAEIPEEIAPFKRFNPTNKHETTVENSIGDKSSTEEIADEPLDEAKELQILRDKLRKYNFMISLPTAGIVMGITIFISCCCTIYLRNRIVACIEMCTPKKKKNKYLNVDPESARRLIEPKWLKNRLSFANKNRARSLSQDQVHVATQDSASIMAREAVETPPTGCLYCCGKKKREKKRKK